MLFKTTTLQTDVLYCNWNWRPEDITQLIGYSTFSFELLEFLKPIYSTIPRQCYAKSTGLSETISFYFRWKNDKWKLLDPVPCFFFVPPLKAEEKVFRIDWYLRYVRIRVSVSQIKTDCSLKRNCHSAFENRFAILEVFKWNEFIEHIFD